MNTETITMRGFVLRVACCPDTFFATYIRGDLRFTEVADAAWFAMERSTADEVVEDLRRETGVEFEIAEHAHVTEVAS